MADVDVKKVIKDLMDTNWSKDNESQGKAAQLIRGLAFSDEDLANFFMKELDKATTVIGKKLLKIESEDEKEEDEENVNESLYDRVNSILEGSSEELPVNNNSVYDNLL